MPTKQEKASGRRVVDANAAKDEISDYQPAEVSDVAIERPTLLSLEARVDELEARLAAIENLEPVRGEQDGFQIDRVAQQEARERRRLLRVKG